jgi:hypothetical protein
MKLDFSHIQRYLRLQGTTETDVLPFGLPPLVIGNVVTISEPVWKTVVATLLNLGSPDLFSNWRWQRPLIPSRAQVLLTAVEQAVSTVENTACIVYPDSLADETRPESARVLSALFAVRDLLHLAVSRGQAVETWAE